jgi:hypothetical protein
MSEELIGRYRILLARLLFEREAAGGEFAEDEESRFVALLDEIWWQLDPTEQELIDQDLGESKPIDVREEIHLVDCDVPRGGSMLPRRAA